VKVTESVSVELEPFAGDVIVTTGAAFPVTVIETCAEPGAPWLSVTEEVIR
jgi:hypothetical protein